jgi:hypothetical protein
MGMLDRAILLSHPKFQQKNSRLIIEVLLDNDYLINFIFNTINSILEYLFKKQKRNKMIFNNERVNDSMKNNRWFTIPYIHLILHRFKNITKDLNTKISDFSLNKLGSIIRALKDSLPNLSQKKCGL